MKKYKKINNLQLTIFYLKTLLKERENFSENFANLIYETEFKLRIWGLTQKDIDLIGEQAYRENFGNMLENYSRSLQIFILLKKEKW